MTDYEFGDIERPAGAGGGRKARTGRPAGLNMQTAAAAVLGIVVIAVLWLIFGPPPAPESAPGLPTATVTPVREAAGASTIRPSKVTTATRQVAAAATAPAGLSVGAFARVGNTDGKGLRFRFGPGTKYLTIRIAGEGELMKVTGGPETEQGVKWWRLQDQHGNVGWAAEEYLAPVAAPAAWNPPAASPTFASANTGATEP